MHRGTLGWSQVHFPVQISSVLKNYAKSTLRVRCRQNNKAWMTDQHMCLQHGLRNIVSPPLRPAAQKKFPSKHYCSFTVHQVGHPRALSLMEMFNAINVVFMPANTIHAVAHGSGRFQHSSLIIYETRIVTWICHTWWFLLWIWVEKIENLLERIHHSRCHKEHVWLIKKRSKYPW